MDSTSQGSLSTQLVAFCRFLRTKGFTIGPREELEMFTVLAQWRFEDPAVFQLMLAHLLCKSRQQQLDFPDLFREFWQELFKSFDSKTKSVRQSKKRTVKPPSLTALKSWLYNKQPAEQHEASFYSRDSGASAGALSNYSSHQIKELSIIIEQLAKVWASTPGRRKITSKKNSGEIDLRRMIRKNMNTGELINITFREPKIQRPRLVLVCDVSKSMEMFSDFTVQLLYAFQSSYRSIETFVFGTQLYHISKLLRNHSFKQSLDLLSDQVPDWSGGTRIGQCLDQLIYQYGSRLLHGKVIFLMISDGWDTGDTELLQRSLGYIKRRVSKLIWLNPQAGKPGFTPSVQGMIAAMPFIDYLHGVHDIDSLRDLKTKI